ncbi:MAG: hypothetical protein JWP52_391 [Rhizobacter sp.]|nr:hypothetical protein [Rhizobacter sp.]
METVSVKEEIAAPIDAVWALLRDFGDIRGWSFGTTLEGVEGSGVGSIRRMQTPGGLFVERCEALDDAGHSFSYAILESPWKIDGYLSKVQLSALGADRCEIEWSSHFEPTAATPDGLTAGVEKMYKRFISNLRKATGAV